MPDLPENYESFVYVITSDALTAEASEGDLHYYVTKLVDALKPGATPPITKSENDISRNIDVYYESPSTLTSTLIRAHDPDVAAARKIEQIDTHLERIAAEARAAGKVWVTRRRLQMAVDHLSQNLIRDTIGVVSVNSKVQCTQDGGIPLPKLIPLNRSGSQTSAGMDLSPISLHLHDSKVTFKFTTDLFAYAASNLSMEDAEYVKEHIRDNALRDINIEASLTINFECLSEVDGEFLPDSQAIVLEVSVKSLTDDIAITPNKKLTDILSRGIPAPEMDAPRSLYRIIMDAITAFFGAILDYVINKFFNKKKIEKDSDEEPAELPRQRSDTSMSDDSDFGVLGSEPLAQHVDTQIHRKRDLLLGYKGFKAKDEAAERSRPNPKLR